MELKTKYNLRQIVYGIGCYSGTDEAYLEICKGMITNIEIRSKDDIRYKVLKNNNDYGTWYPESHIYLADEVEQKVHDFMEENKKLEKKKGK